MSRVLLMAAAALGLSACAHAEGLPAGAHFVNMGSSFAAGAGTGPSPAGAPTRCFQSAVNYARLLAQRLDLSLTDVSCGGATSGHLIGAWNELPPQLDAVTSETSLVTITIGGNDVAYVGNLIAASCEQGESIRAAGMVLSCPAPFAVSEGDYGRLERNLREIARQIALRAPRARTIFIQYVALVPQTQCSNSRFTEVEARDLRAVGSRLAQITAQVASESGAEVLRVDEMSRRHTPCDPDPWSVGLPRDYDESQGAPWHPNARGMEAIADRLEQVLAYPGN